MDEVMEYCHYILSKKQSISLCAAAPNEYKRKKDILERFVVLMGYSPISWPAFNDKLAGAIKWLLDDSGLLNTRFMEKEAEIVYKRCRARIPTIDYSRRPDGYIIDYEEVFEILCDFIWLYVSQQICRSKGSQELILTDDFLMLHQMVKELYGVLDELRFEAECECNEIAEALELRHRILPSFFPWLIPNDRVRWYCSLEISEGDFRQMKYEKEKCVEWMRYIYFALIATAVRFEETRRG